MVNSICTDEQAFLDLHLATFFPIPERMLQYRFQLGGTREQQLSKAMA